MTISDPWTEKLWWDAHADRIHVWGEHGDRAWGEGVFRCVDAILSCVRPLDGTVLDLGCGLGRLMIPLAHMFPESDFVGVDVSAEMLVQATEHAHVMEVSNCGFFQCDGRSLPPAARRMFDVAYSVLLFQHLPPDAVSAYIRDVAGTLVRGGRFVVQYVVDQDAPTTSSGSFLSWAHSPASIEAVGREVGLDTVEHRRGLIYPEWAWTTMIAR